jgi:hypothetical protein
LMDEFAKHGSLSTWIDGLYQNIYDRQSESFLAGRMDEVHAYCLSERIPFIVSEWGLATTASGGKGDHPAFITWFYNKFKSLSRAKHHCMFEGNQDNGMIENGFTDSIDRYRELFGNP